MTAQPLWLASQDVRELLTLLVDRLDSADHRGTKAQSVALAEKSWPALYKASFESGKEKLWEHVGEMSDWGWLQVTPVGAAKARDGYDRKPRVTVLDEAAVRQAVGRPERIKSSVERWRQAVNSGLEACDEVKRIVGDYCIDTPDHSMAEVVQQLNRLPSFASRPMLLREVSTQLFWGMSKVLDKRQGMVAAILGVDECPFPDAPIQLHVYLPPTGYRGVLFIENVMNFEQAQSSTSGAFDGLALVFASGFKGSAQRLRSPIGCSLYYASRGAQGGDLKVAFEAWLFGRGTTPAHFWGDLDYSGMRILAAMRSTFPEMSAWSPGYAPMLAALLDGHGHSPEAAEKQGQRPIASTGCAYADSRLIPAIDKTGRYLDQELFTS